MSWGCDIDGMLFELFLNFINIEKKIVLFSWRFMLFPIFF